MKTIIDEGAMIDIAESEAWYEEKQEGLGYDFRRVVLHTIERLPPDRPRKLPGAPGHYYVTTGRFPFRVVFSLEPDCVFVAAVAHNRRSDGYWLRR